MLEQIKRKVEEKVNASNQQIILGMYQKMIHAHNEHCGCNYCEKLKGYIQMKRYLSARNRYMDGPEYNFWSNMDVIRDLEGIDKIKLEIKRLKFEKDKLKLI
jgi:hypothetical protein